MPFTRYGFFKQTRSEFVDLHILVLGHDGQSFVRLGVNERPYLFSSEAHALGIKKPGVNTGVNPGNQGGEINCRGIAHAAFPYMPSYVTGDFLTMRSTCFGRGMRSPRRHDATVRIFAPNNFAALLSPTCSMNAFRFTVAVIHGLCEASKWFIHTKLNAFRARHD